MSHFWVLIICLFLGGVAGTVSGLLGFGAGIVVVPVLYWVYKFMGFPPHLLMHLAIGSALSVIVVTASNAMYRHCQKGSIHWGMFWRFIPVIALSALFSLLLRPYLGPTLLHYAFIAYVVSVFIFSIAKKSFSKIKLSDNPTVPGYFLFCLYGSIVGVLGASLAMTGSPIMMNFFRRLKLPMARAAGMTVSLSLPLAIIGTAGHLFATEKGVELLPLATGLVYWPAVCGVAIGTLVGVPFGVRQAFRVSDVILARAYLSFLSLILLIAAL